ELTLAIVAVKLRTGWLSVGVERGSVGNENVVRAVPVVVKDSCPCARAFQNEILLDLAAEGVGDSQPSLGCNVDEPDARCLGHEEQGRKPQRASPHPERHLAD